MSPQPEHLLSITWFHKPESSLPAWTSGDIGRLPTMTHFLLFSPQWFWGHTTSSLWPALSFAIFVSADGNLPESSCLQMSGDISAAHIRDCCGSNRHSRQMFFLPERSESFVVLIIIVWVITTDKMWINLYVSLYPSTWHIFTDLILKNLK